MLIKVPNKDRANAAAPFYYYLEDQNGNEYLFSESQLEVAKERAKDNPEDLPYIASKESNAVIYILASIAASLLVIFLVLYFLG